MARSGGGPRVYTVGYPASASQYDQWGRIQTIIWQMVRMQAAARQRSEAEYEKGLNLFIKNPALADSQYGQQFAARYGSDHPEFKALLDFQKQSSTDKQAAMDHAQQVFGDYISRVDKHDQEAMTSMGQARAMPATVGTDTVGPPTISGDMPQHQDPNMAKYDAATAALEAGKRSSWKALIETKPEDRLIVAAMMKANGIKMPALPAGLDTSGMPAGEKMALTGVLDPQDINPALQTAAQVKPSANTEAQIEARQNAAQQSEADKIKNMDYAEKKREQFRASGQTMGMPAIMSDTGQPTVNPVAVWTGKGFRPAPSDLAAGYSMVKQAFDNAQGSGWQVNDKEKLALARVAVAEAHLGADPKDTQNWLNNMANNGGFDRIKQDKGPVAYEQNVQKAIAARLQSTSSNAGKAAGAQASQGLDQDLSSIQATPDQSQVPIPADEPPQPPPDSTPQPEPQPQPEPAPAIDNSQLE